jgi:diacylglycerol kinase (ATP)
MEAIHRWEERNTGTSRWDPCPGRHILAIYNPAAGRRSPGKLNATVRELELCGFHVDVIETTGPGDASHFAEAASTAGHDLILAAGGDGTVREVANGLMSADTPLPLAVLPIGTANVLAEELGLPASPRTFAQTLAATRSRPAWLGTVNGQCFSLMASVGFDARVVNAVDDMMKPRMGKAAYLVAALRRLMRLDPCRYRVVVDGKEFDAAGVVVCKGRFYGGRFVVAPQARVTDPTLHVCLLPGSRHVDLCRYAACLVSGGLWRAAGAVILPAHHVRIEGPDAEPVQCDGDIVTRLPAEITVSPRPIEIVMA